MAAGRKESAFRDRIVKESDRGAEHDVMDSTHSPRPSRDPAPIDAILLVIVRNLSPLRNGNAIGSRRSEI